MDSSMEFSELSLAELKAKSPADLLTMAEDLEIENASTMRKGDMMFVCWRFLKMGLGFCVRQRQTICRVQMIFM